MKKNILQTLILIFAISISNYGQNNSNSGETLFQEIDKLHKKELIEASRRINVSTLKDAKFKDNEAELRLWTIDHFFIESFILQRKNDQWKARHISFDNQEGKIEQDVYLKPENSWKNLNQYLKDNKLTFDLQLTQEEENFPIHPDAMFFLIEARAGKKYSMSWYIMNTRVKDGIKVQNLCDKINKEFNIDFVCKYDVQGN